jgi:hypothetical protein
LPLVLTTLMGRSSGSRDSRSLPSSEPAKAGQDRAPNNRNPRPSTLKFPSNERSFFFVSIQETGGGNSGAAGKAHCRRWLQERAFFIMKRELNFGLGPANLTARLSILGEQEVIPQANHCLDNSYTASVPVSPTSFLTFRTKFGMFLP